MTIYAFVLINSEVGHETKLIPELKMIDNISEVALVLGLYDIVVKLEADNVQKLENSITEIRKLPGIKSTLSMMTTPHEDLLRSSNPYGCD
ncbi:MAG: Lrp/AsnC ligand binding domain-containing protein [Promethearchaeota archaeon]